MIHRSISNIAELRTGYTPREKPRLSESGVISIIQMKNIDSRGNLSEKQLDRIEPFPKCENQFLRPGDNLILTRGTRNPACVFKGIASPAIAVSHFTIITIKNKEILPGYLAVFLNHPRIQMRIREITRGSTLPTVSIKELAELEVSIPSLEAQQVIVELNDQLQKAEDIEAKIRTKRKALVEREFKRFFE